VEEDDKEEAPPDAGKDHHDQRWLKHRIEKFQPWKANTKRIVTRVARWYVFKPKIQIWVNF
jgi:hypothetical protein